MGDRLVNAVNPITSKWRTFSTQVPGKWVLAGEHTVLRGGSAIALPHPEFKLHLEYRPGTEALRVEPDLATPVLHDLLKIGREWLGRRGVLLETPRGTVYLKSTIPFGAGLGSSAALSVAAARWILSSHSLDRSLERELAREMENRFHGKSSGMDVAVVSLGEPILFSMAEGAVALGIQILPEFEFVDSGLRASTRECIERVEKRFETDPELARGLDEKMKGAVTRILDGLRLYNEAPSRDALIEIEKGMADSALVFQAWGLVPLEVQREIDRLLQSGYAAPRLTGAGGGGFIVALRSK